MELRELSALAQKAWEKAISLPTKENIEAYEAIEDEYRIKLELDRNSKMDRLRSSNGNNNVSNSNNYSIGKR